MLKRKMNIVITKDQRTGERVDEVFKIPGTAKGKTTLAKITTYDTRDNVRPQCVRIKVQQKLNGIAYGIIRGGTNE